MTAVMPTPAAQPPFRLFDATVVATQRVSPTFVRITFGGRSLRDFAWDGLDQRIKVLFPNARGGYPAMPPDDEAWYARWSALSDDERPPMRTYTIRDLREGFSGVEVDVDFALHAETAGPGAGWAAAAQQGQTVRMLGPNAAHPSPRGAIGWIPPHTARRFVIAGDETAVPAIDGILRSLPAGIRARVYLEVPHADDMAALDSLDGHEVTVLARGDAHRVGDDDTPPLQPGSLLADAVCDAIPVPKTRGAARRLTSEELEDIDVDSEVLWEVPGMDPATGAALLDDQRRANLYVWLAGEAAAIKRIRRHLVREVGIDRAAVSFMGYWRLGRSES